MQKTKILDWLLKRRQIAGPRTSDPGRSYVKQEQILYALYLYSDLKLNMGVMDALVRAYFRDYQGAMKGVKLKKSMPMERLHHFIYMVSKLPPDLLHDLKTFKGGPLPVALIQAHDKLKMQAPVVEFTFHALSDDQATLELD